ncbi:hypothetical protein EAF04_000793 [Stromatinia cepivora]|nr:hypothetical protein EAF04_000793 [Stromatinia cepivora]
MVEGVLGIVLNYISKQGYGIIIRYRQFPKRLSVNELYSIFISINIKPFKTLKIKITIVKGKISIDLQIVNIYLKELLIPKLINKKNIQIIIQKEE